MPSSRSPVRGRSRAGQSGGELAVGPQERTSRPRLLSRNTRAHGSLTARDQDRYPANAFFGNADSPETWQNQNQNQQILNFNLTHLFGDDTILDVKYNRQWKEFIADAPNNPDLLIGSRDFLTGKEFGGLTSALFHMICRCSWGTGANLSHFRENASGSHELKAGFFFDFPNSEWEFAYPRNEDISQYLSGGHAFRVLLRWFPFESQRDIDRYSFFVQDQWTIGDRLTLNLGVRYVTSEGWLPEQARGGGRWFPRVVFPETRDLINFDNVAPRLGVVYALGEEKRTSLKAYYGRHYKALLTQDLATASPVSGGSETYIWNDVNGDLRFQDGEQGTLIGRVLNPVFGDRSDVVVPDLKNSYVDAFHITADHELTSEMVLSVGGTFKRERSLVETFVRREGGDQQNPFNDYRPLDVVNQADGSPLTIFALRPEFLGSLSNRVLGNPDFAGKLFRDYNGVEFALRRRFRDGWQLMVAYNLSETRGNLANDFAGTTTANQVYDDPNTLINAEGVLALDATHQFKLQGTYTLPYDILVSGFYQAVTGFPIHLRESNVFDLTQGAPTARYFPLCPGTGVTKGHIGGCRPPPLGVPGIVVEGAIAVAAFPRGTERHAFKNKIDVRVEKQFRFGNGMRLGLIADIFNLGNINRVTSFQSLTIDQAAPFLAAADTELPRILRVGVRFSF